MNGKPKKQSEGTILSSVELHGFLLGSWWDQDSDIIQLN